MQIGIRIGIKCKRVPTKKGLASFLVEEGGFRYVEDIILTSVLMHNLRKVILILSCHYVGEPGSI